ncbi:integrin alpha-6 isoform X2 [Polypterus senegalus]|uniref:integrin alpha-6 isoform X2 n=1 Tax=Polypterus senegalus TaxID=55291 RepID=UPI001965DDD2|nr:integrin alpha-6 isoform X2 [Polypterus senegalus]
MALSAGVFLFYLALCKWTSTTAFNLDADGAIRKIGEPGSLFGFSLAMHRQLKPSDTRYLLVGAPRAKALSKQKANVTGGLYSCQLSTQPNDCQRIDFDNEADPSKESKENQWMGVVVQSQGPGGKIVTCAHRYEKRQFVNTDQESRDIIGRCYVLSEDFKIHDEMDGGHWKFCDGRLRGHERFGSCQQGLSATFTKDYHYIIFGAPGTYNWKGIVRVEQKNSSLLDLDIFEDGPYEVGDENRFDENLVPVPANSYLGFSLDSGSGITNKENLTFVAGAPRANHSGAVVLLKKLGQYTRQLVEEYILEGEGLASSFGYDVAVVDLNNDGWQDLVVGAPQFFVRDGEIGGRVYVYINKAGKWNTVKPIRLNGTKDSMFGLSVENIGDVNQDGFQDFAVGAPYDGGSGKVYIYHGSSKGINTIPAQVIDGKDLGSKFFGYSLAGNMDLDSNGYPDVAVGSLSDSLFVFRAKPVISIQKSITIKPERIDLNNKNCKGVSGNCMTVEACFKYTAVPANYNPPLTIGYTFEAEMERRKLEQSSRVVFLKKQPGDPEYQSSGTVQLSKQNTMTCVNTELKLQDNIQDKLRPIPITVAVNIKQATRNRRQNAAPPLLPVLSINDPPVARSEVNFLKEGCGSDNICQSNLKLQYEFFSKDGKQDLFQPLPIGEDGIPVISLSQQKDIAVKITVTNTHSDPKNPLKDGDDAHEAKLTAAFPDTLSYSAFRDDQTSPDRPVTCNANSDGSEAVCELGNPFKRNSKTSFFLIMGTSGISLDTSDVEINLTLATTSEQKNLEPLTARAKVFIELLLSVSGVAKPSQVYFGGTVVGESAMKTEDDVGSLIEYEFRIINLGKPLKTLGTAYLDISWPKEILNGKWLLYLVKTDTKGLETKSCSPLSEINPRRLKDSPTVSRKKRDIREKRSENDGKLFLFSEKRKYTTLDCSNTRCVTIQCPLQGLDSNAFVVLRSRIWNSTFLEEYSTMNYLDILIKATIKIDSSAKNIRLRNADTQVRTTVFPEKTVAPYTGIPWWIILVAILAGILMLGLLVFLLWKCGFFKRAKKDQYDAAYHKAEIHVQPSDKERLTTDA